jgi:hypothetical protein
MAAPMDQAQSGNRPNLQTTIRTLLLSGFKIENNRRQPTHTEIYCSAQLLGSDLPLLLVLTEEDELLPSIRPHIQRAAERGDRTRVIVANAPGPDQLSWEDFLETLGGAVPSWRALGDTGQSSSRFRFLVGKIN